MRFYTTFLPNRPNRFLALSNFLSATEKISLGTITWLLQWHSRLFTHKCTLWCGSYLLIFHVQYTSPLASTVSCVYHIAKSTDCSKTKRACPEMWTVICSGINHGIKGYLKKEFKAKTKHRHRNMSPEQPPIFHLQFRSVVASK